MNFKILILIEFIFLIKIYCPNNPPYCIYDDKNKESGILIKYFLKYFKNKESIKFYNNLEENVNFDIIIDCNNDINLFEKYDLIFQLKINLNIIKKKKLFNFKILKIFLVMISVIFIVLSIFIFILIFIQKNLQYIELNFNNLIYYFSEFCNLLFFKFNIKLNSKFSFFIYFITSIFIIIIIKILIIKINEYIYYNPNNVNIFNEENLFLNTISSGNYFNNNNIIIYKSNIFNLEEYFLNSNSNLLIIDNKLLKLLNFNLSNYNLGNLNYLFGNINIFYKKGFGYKFKKDIFYFIYNNFKLLNDISIDINDNKSLFKEFYILVLYFMIWFIIIFLFFKIILDNNSNSDYNDYINIKYKFSLIKKNIRIEYNKELFWAITNILKIYKKKYKKNLTYIFESLNYYKNKKNKIIDSKTEKNSWLVINTN